MSKAIQHRLDELTERAALRSMAIRRAPEPPFGWELSSPFRVVCSGSLDNVEAWLTAAEQRDGYGQPIRSAGGRADS
ncbi:hypothetical protein [Nocardia mangyaensis]|uniref:hypothetical protein n=1 Tax=Nocardia mangyaensis TaxID=2213200 RepID=UPI0026761E2F|nr:hypothetical protein [Nocardia mangyaensis]MDO3648652.1 hypothetical protein [Nocardia mangyaensis]